MENWNEIKVWRKAQRAELIAARTAIAPDQRRLWSQRITGLLEAGFAPPSGTVIGFCWPYKGEFDARFAVRRWRERGAVAALPEVIEGPSAAFPQVVARRADEAGRLWHPGTG